MYDLSTFVFKNLRRLFNKYAIARTEHGALVFSNFVAFSEIPNFLDDERVKFWLNE